MRQVSITVGTCLLAILSGLTGCKPKAAAPQMQMPPPNVTVAKPEQRKIVEWDQYTGRLEAKEAVEIRPRVSGWLDKVHFTEGSEVKMGDILFTIDPRPYRMAAERADAEFARAESRESQTKNEFSRVKQLVETKAISQEDFETRGKAYAEAQSASRAAKAALEMARLDLEFTEVRAPIAGRISRALVTQGNLVSAGMAGSGASLLTTIVSTTPIYLYVDVNEASSLRYRRVFAEAKGSPTRIPCEMAVGDEEGWPHKGYVDFVDNRVDPNTGTTRARAVFDVTGPALAPGFFARLRIPAGDEKLALLVPESCIGSDQANRFVFVVGANGMAEIRGVKLGTTIDGMRVVREGLKGDEDVIVNGQARVRPGMPVKVVPAGK
jgi:membrane fusion protein, multidrug efflux system